MEIPSTVKIKGCVGIPVEVNDRRVSVGESTMLVPESLKEELRNNYSKEKWQHAMYLLYQKVLKMERTRLKYKSTF